MGAHLGAALKAVDWSSNIDRLCSHDDLASRVEACNRRLALWAGQIEIIDKVNPALAFVREMQHGGHNVASCIALALYKPAASSMRALVECALYYSYFRRHPAELSSLLVDDNYYVTKKDIIEFCRMHVREFKTRQGSIGMIDRLERWYSKTSSIVHGQIPGQWVIGSSLADVAHDDELLEEVVAHFEQASGLVNDFFLCVMAGEIWAYVDSNAKKSFLHGISGSAKAALKLDEA